MLVAAAAALVLGTPSSQCPYAYQGAAASNLRVNHGQILATHNSYHIGTTVPGWDYTHPPLPMQLASGIRGFELDIYYDPETSEFKVIHVVSADEGTTCKNLAECMRHIQTWRTDNPFHYPLFVQLELGGTLTTNTAEIAANACTYDSMRAAAECSAEVCSGITADALSSCIIGKCSSKIDTQNSACGGMLFCLPEKLKAFDAAHKITSSEIIEIVQLCAVPTPGAYSEVELTTAEEQALEIMTALEAAINTTFPLSQRITPSDVVKDDANNTYTWPLVEDSRGKAMFWLTQTPTGWPSSTSSGGFFVDSDPGDGPIMKTDNIRSFGKDKIRDLLNKGYWLRSRADDVYGYDAAIRSDTVEWGASTVSTDHPPNSSSTSAKTYPWGATQEWPTNGQMILKGGSPVRCNTALLASLDAHVAVACSALALEDPAFVQCTSNVTTLGTTLNSAVITGPSLGVLLVLCFATTFSAR